MKRSKDAQFYSELLVSAVLRYAATVRRYQLLILKTFYSRSLRATPSNLSKSG